MESFLTERQKEILDFIRANVERRGVAPTHREICERFGYSSYGTAHKHLKLLEKKGYLKRQWNQKRGIQLTGEAGRSAPDGGEIPFLGLIAAGRPIESVNTDERVQVPPQLLHGRSGEHYVLKVQGESMIEEGIHDGDLVVVLRRQEARPGEMVVALVADEVTLKRFFPEGATVRLQPANRTMEPIRVRATDVKVQGIVVGLMRRF
ncbi:MAG: transcriptional repressor LexA [Thermoanaerobaculia bacterium]|nr:transcriptional repressor LexA [Thermoanaerobaculia bacterium]